MAQAKRDQNNVPTLLGVSNADGVTPVVLYADPTTHRLLTDTAAGSGITSINTDATAAQTLTVGTTGTDFAIVDNGTGDHKFNLPTASHTNRGALSSADWDTFNAKGSGTVTAVSVATANGVSGSSSGGATPALTLTLGAITPTTVNALTLASQAVGFTVAGGTTSKTLTVPLDASVSGTNTGDNTVATALTGTPSITVATVTTTGNIELGNASDTTIARSGAGVLAVEGIVIPSISSTNTLTNKRITARVYSAANNASLTPEKDTYDIFHLTAMSAATTINNPSTTTPADGDQMRFRFLDNGTPRALTWDTAYVAKGGIALPTTTVLSKNLEVGFEYNANLTKWNLLASAQEV